MPRLLVAALVSVVLLGSVEDVIAQQRKAQHGGAPVPQRSRLRVFTLAGSVWPASTPGAQLLAGIVSRERRDGLWLMPDRRIRFGATVSGRWQEVTSPSPIGSAAASHVAVVADGDDVVLYVGGHEVARSPFGLPRQPFAFRVMRRVYKNGRAYRRALSPEDIRALAGPVAPSEPPTVTAVSPVAGARRVALDVQPEVLFSEALEPGSVGAATVQLLDARGVAVNGVVAYDSARFAVRFIPAEPLLPTRWYTLAVAGGDVGDRIVSGGGVALAAPVHAEFMTTLERARVAAGEAHSVVVDETGQVWTWGSNAAGQLGRSGTTVMPGPVSGVAGVVSVAAGVYHTLALTEHGQVFAWGQNALGQLGRGTTTPTVQPTPLLIEGLADVVAVGASFWTSVALKADGTVWVWGLVQGLGGALIRPTPAAVTGVSDVVSIAQGLSHVLALTADGRVWGWGANASGEVGDGTRVATTAPVQVPGLAHVGGVAAGVSSSYALTQDLTVMAWGRSEDGVTVRNLPSMVAGLADVRAVAAGQQRAFAVQLDGRVLTWGTAPVPVDGVAAAWQVAAGFSHQVALSRDGVVSAWSNNSAGQLGDGSTISRPAPVSISGAGFAWKSPVPVLSHASGTYSINLPVTIATADAAVIHYTIDGSDPTEASATIASGGTVSVTGDTTLKARAWAPGRLASDVTSAAYLFKAATPTMLPPGGTYFSPPFVGISSSAGASIHYTIDGSDPTPASPLYTDTLRLFSTATVKAIAVKPGWALSDMAVETYRLSLGPLASPVMTPPAGTYASGVTVTLAAPAGATVTYTIDGTVPGPGSPVYVGPLVITAKTTVRARAFKPDYDDSPLAEATYVIAAPVPAIVPGEGQYSEPQQVRISTTVAGATLHYTLDGSVPGETSPLYEGPLFVDGPTTVRARTFSAGVEPSATTTAIFSFQAAKPVASLRPGVYALGEQVVLTAGEGSEIRYRLDGTTPTPSSMLYGEPVLLPPGPATLTAIAFRPGWEPSAMLVVRYTTSTDTVAPTITSEVSPPPAADGWHSGNVTVTFHCTDAESLVTFCTPPVTVSGEGEAIEVRGLGRDAVGNLGALSVTVNIDRTRPMVSLFSPLQDDTVPLGTGSVAVHGGAWDLSGIAAMNCDGEPAVLDGTTFSCVVPVRDGLNTVRITAEDRVGHIELQELDVHVGEGPPPVSIRFAPARMTLIAGEQRDVALVDERGRPVPFGEWQVSLEGVVSVIAVDSAVRLEAVAAGQTVLTASYGPLVARAEIDVLGAGVEPVPGTILWSLDDTTTPLRASVIAATPAIDSDPRNSAALFYLDEGTEWFGPVLLRPTGTPIVIRATTADGRQLWERTFTVNTTVKHAVPDHEGGLVVVWNQWFDGTTSISHSDMAQRFDGRTGHITWEHRPQPAAFVSEVAAHPDGRIFFTEQRIFGASHLVAMSSSGAMLRTLLPSGHFARADRGTGLVDADVARPAKTTHPVVLDDGTVVVVTQRNITREVVTSRFDEIEGLVVDLDPDESTSRGEALVVRVKDGILEATQIPGIWNDFRPEDYRLLPDGHDGLLLGDRTLPHVLRIAPDDTVVASTLLDPGGYTYGTEYVLGDGAAYMLVHGAVNNGMDHWSSSVAFDPATLTRLASTSLWRARPVPSHLRLGFALAGGGVFLSGPEAPQAAHATHLGGGAWAGWSGGPALIAGNTPVVAETEWPSPGGTNQGTLVAFHPGFGLFAKSHRVAGLGRHVSLRIVPRDQDYWTGREPAVFVNVDDRGRRFATLGAGTGNDDTSTACDGSQRLISDFNRFHDVYDQPRLLEKLRYAGVPENDVIELLFSLERTYRDDLPYCFLPVIDSESYNSNSYIGGLLRAARIPRPVTPGTFLFQYPGWLKPVPPSAFQPREQAQ